MIELREAFNTTLILDNNLLPNNLEIIVNITPNMIRQKLYNKGMDRLQFYIQELLDNSFFLSSADSTKLNSIPFKAQAHLFPDQPYDHLIAMCLYVKLNSIAEEVFYIDNVTVTSTQARGVSHSFSRQDGGAENLMTIFPEEDIKKYVEYWYKPIPQFFLLDNGLKLITQSWKDVGLHYTDKENEAEIIKLIIPKKKKDKDDE